VRWDATDWLYLAGLLCLTYSVTQLLNYYEALTRLALGFREWSYWHEKREAKRLAELEERDDV